MDDDEWVSFLRWALPRLGFRWSGFRKVRRQVRKRVARRMRGLGLDDLTAYRALLLVDSAEWAALDSLCRITISRFCRDRSVFDHLSTVLLPELAEKALGRGECVLRCWSAGCASGEEPYSLAILWRQALARTYPGLALDILATDADEAVLARARRACYQAGSLRDLPPEWRDSAFEASGHRFCLRPPYGAGVRFRRQDIRTRMPRGPFDLVLCRNLAFTYFEEELQRRVLGRIAHRLAIGGALVLGAHETLPTGCTGFDRVKPRLPVWRASLDGDGASSDG